jgi:hypothetical protein
MNEIPNINANNQINANGIPIIGINNGPSIIPTISPPVIQQTQQSVITNLEVPIFRFTDPSFKYPTLRVPTQAEFDEAVRAEKQAQEDEKAEKSRGLPNAPVPFIPQVVVPPPTQEVPNVQTPPVETGIPIIEVPILGPIPVPPKEQVILAGTTATASVAAALIGKSLVEWLVAKMKPIVQQTICKR